MPVSHRLMCHCCIEIKQMDNKFKINELLNSSKMNVAKVSQFAPICRLFPYSYHIYNSFTYFFTALPCPFQHFMTVSSYYLYSLLLMYLCPPLPLSCVHARMRLFVYVHASHVRVPQNYAGLKDDKYHQTRRKKKPLTQ